MTHHLRRGHPDILHKILSDSNSILPAVRLIKALVQVLVNSSVAQRVVDLGQGHPCIRPLQFREPTIHRRQQKERFRHLCGWLCPHAGGRRQWWSVGRQYRQSWHWGNQRPVYMSVISVIAEVVGKVITTDSPDVVTRILHVPVRKTKSLWVCSK